MHAGRASPGGRATEHLRDREPGPGSPQGAQPLRLAQEQVGRAVVVPLREPVAARRADPDGVVDAASSDRFAPEDAQRRIAERLPQLAFQERPAGPAAGRQALTA